MDGMDGCSPPAGVVKVTSGYDCPEAQMMLLMGSPGQSDNKEARVRVCGFCPSVVLRVRKRKEKKKKKQQQQQHYGYSGSITIDAYSRWLFDYHYHYMKLP
jgi:hypothetical protein